LWTPASSLNEVSLKFFQLTPSSKRQLARFKSIKRGYWSFIIFSALIFLSVFLELLISERALVVKYNDKYYFPTYGQQIPGLQFGLDYEYETNYRELKAKLAGSPDHFVILPLVPWGPLENDLEARFDANSKRLYPPFAPDIGRKHYFGTDSTGRDILARLFYGFRIAIAFSIFLLFINYIVGIAIGCFMGWFGGRTDLYLQRFIEVLSNIPFLYVVMIVASIVTPTFFSLALIMAAFGWINMTWYMRTATYREKARDYILAARSLGASDTRIIFKHIIPNSLALIITFIPFSISGGIVSLTSLDFLGYGLPAPTPSWGGLLDEGVRNLSAHWIITSVVTAMVIILVVVTFMGEAIREAFDPKKHTTYE
jgi:microcin C transport system permease protein